MLNVQLTQQTGLGNSADLDSLFFGHETKHREDGKTGVQTCTAVDDRQDDAVPGSS